MRNFTKKTCVVMAIVMMLGMVSWSGCGKTEENKVVIGYQQGVGSTAFMVMEKLGVLQECLPEGYCVEYSTMSGGGAAIREALSTGSVDVGLMGTPPVVIGADKGLPIKVICGIANSPISLLTSKEEIKTIEDIKDEKIALLAYGSIQHISLAMMADKVFGDPLHFDPNLVTLAEAEAYVAMESGAEIDVYFGLNPTKTRVAHLEGVHEIDNTKNYDINISSLIACINTDYAEENADVAPAIKLALEQTFDWIEEHPDETVEIVAEALSIDEEILQKVYAEEKFGTEIYGYDECAAYMSQLEMIENEPVKLEDMMIR